MKVIKINEDDILDIIIEHYMSVYPEFVFSNASILGKPNNDLRCICLLGEKKLDEITDEKIFEIDNNYEFNGEHAFLEKNSDFYLENQ